MESRPLLHNGLSLPFVLLPVLCWIVLSCGSLTEPKTSSQDYRILRGLYSFPALPTTGDTVSVTLSIWYEDWFVTLSSAPPEPARADSYRVQIIYRPAESLHRSPPNGLDLAIYQMGYDWVYWEDTLAVGQDTTRYQIEISPGRSGWYGIGAELYGIAYTADTGSALPYRILRGMAALQHPLHSYFFTDTDTAWYGDPS